MYKIAYYSFSINSLNAILFTFNVLTGQRDSWQGPKIINYHS